MASNIVRIAYGVVKGAGIDTSDMTVDEVIAKMNELQDSDKVSKRDLDEKKLKEKGYTAEQLKDKSNKEIEKKAEPYQPKDYRWKASFGTGSDSNSGYSGYSMSNRAVEAYASGEQPLSKWSKDDILEAIKEINPDIYDEAKKLSLGTLKDLALSQSSWHHTSNYFNKTDFYAIDEDDIKELTSEKIAEAAKEQKEENERIKQAKAKNKDTVITAKIHYTEWVGGGRYKKPVEKEEIVSYSPNDSMINTASGSKRLTSVKVIESFKDTKPMTEEQFGKASAKKARDEAKAAKERWKKTFAESIEHIREAGNTEEVIETYRKLGKDGFDISASGKYYAKGRKPDAANYNNPNWFKKGEKRLVYDSWRDKYDIEVYNGKEWERKK